jgi:hypothetical protein
VIAPRQPGTGSFGCFADPSAQTLLSIVIEVVDALGLPEIFRRCLEVLCEGSEVVALSASCGLGMPLAPA